MGTENVSLGVQELENKADNFDCYFLEGFVVNWMIKCDEQWESNHKYIYNLYILRSKMLMS